MDDAENRLTRARMRRDLAREIIRTDIATLRSDGTNRLVSDLKMTLRSGIDLVRGHKVIMGAGVLASAGWLFRKPLTALVKASAKRGVAAWVRWRK